MGKPKVSGQAGKGAKRGVRAIIGFEAHQPEHLECRDLFDSGLAFLRSLGIETLSHLEGPVLY